MHKQWVYRHIGAHPRVPPTGFRSVNETQLDDLVRPLVTASKAFNTPRPRSRSPSRSPSKPSSHLSTLYARDKLVLNDLADECLRDVTASQASKPGGRGGAKPSSPPYGIAPHAASGAGARRASRSAMALAGTSSSRAASVMFVDKQRASVGEDAGGLSLAVPPGPAAAAASVAGSGALPKIGSSVTAHGEKRGATVREVNSVSTIGNSCRIGTASRAVSRLDGLDTALTDPDSGSGSMGVMFTIEVKEESCAKKYKDMVKPKQLVSEEASALESVEKSKVFVHSVAEDFEGYLKTIASIDPMLEVDERLRKMSMESSSQQQQQNLDASQQLTPRESTPLQLIITDGATGLAASSQALATFATNDLFSSESVADKPSSPPSGSGGASIGESTFVQTVMTQLYPTLSKQTSFLTSLVLQVQPELHAPMELLHYIEHDLGFPLDLYCPATWPNLYTLPSHMVAATVGIPKHTSQPNTFGSSQGKQSSGSTIKVVRQPHRASVIYRRSISLGAASSFPSSATARRASHRSGSFVVRNRSRKASRANSILLRSRLGSRRPTSDKTGTFSPSQSGSRPGSQPNSRPGSVGASSSELSSRRSRPHSQAPSRGVSATSSAALTKLASASADVNETTHSSPSSGDHRVPFRKSSGITSPSAGSTHIVPTVVVADGSNDGNASSQGQQYRLSAATVVSIVSPDSMPNSASSISAARERVEASHAMLTSNQRFQHPMIQYPPIRVKVQKRKVRRVDDLYTRELDIIAPAPSASLAKQKRTKRGPCSVRPPAPWYRPPQQWYSPSPAAPPGDHDPMRTLPTISDDRGMGGRTAVSQRLAQLTERSRAEFLALEAKYRLDDASGCADSFNGMPLPMSSAGGTSSAAARKSVSAATFITDRRKSTAVLGQSRVGSIGVGQHYAHGGGSADSGGSGSANE